MRGEGGVVKWGGTTRPKSIFEVGNVQDESKIFKFPAKISNFQARNLKTFTHTLVKIKVSNVNIYRKIIITKSKEGGGGGRKMGGAC